MTVKKNIPIGVVLGPRKCGTTTLHSLLSQVSEFAVPSPLKEAHIFDRRAIALGELRGHCGKTWTDETQAFIDVATHYFSQEELWPNIAGSEGFAGVAVIVRDPIERAVSHCMHQMRINNLWTSPFADIVELFPEVITDSLYSAAITRLQTFFGVSNVRLIRFEKLATDPLAVVSDLCGDLELVEFRPSINLQAKQMNQGVRPRFSWAYTALREGARVVRSVVGDASVERIKNTVMPYWPASDHSVIKSRILNELREDAIGQELILERGYVADLVEKL